MRNRNILLEGSRDNALMPYVDLLNKRGIDSNVSQLKQFMLRKLVNEAGMHNLSLRSNFYLVGAVRYYFNGDLTDNKRLNVFFPKFTDRFKQDICQRLDALIGILRDSYIDSVGEKWEQPEDFGTLSIDRLLRKYGKKIDVALGITNKEADSVQDQQSNDVSAGKKYDYEILYSYDDARKYQEPTHPGSWCITYGQNHYNSYIKNLKIHYVVFRQKGYEGIPRRVGPGFTKQKPHDAYGNSLICVLQSNSSPEPVYITSRWNHGSTSDRTQGIEADHAYTKEEFLNVIGCDESVLVRAYNQWKTNKTRKKHDESGNKRQDVKDAVRQLKYAQMRLNNGENPIDVFEKRIIVLNNSSERESVFELIRNKEYSSLMKYPLIAYVKLSDGIWYGTVLYKRKLYFDTFIGTRSIGNSPVVQCFGDNACLRDVFGKMFFFNRQKGSFMDISGVKGVKQVPSIFTMYSDIRKGPSYFCVAMSGNQVALVNYKTLKPVLSKNGEGWFEIIVPYGTGYYENSNNYGRRNQVNLYAGENPRYWKLVYDSSSMENYIFDTETGKLQDFSGMVIIANPPMQDCALINKMDMLDDGTENDSYFLLKIEDKTRIEIDGVSQFAQIIGAGPLIAFKKEDGQPCHFYDKVHNVGFELPGFTKLSYMNYTPKRQQVEKDSDWVTIIGFSGTWSRLTYLYYPETQQLDGQGFDMVDVRNISPQRRDEQRERFSGLLERMEKARKLHLHD